MYVCTYGTALVQRHKYTRAAHVVAVCGPRMYSRDTQFASNL